MPFIKRANLKHPLCWLLEASADKMEGLSSSVTSSLDTSHARKAAKKERRSATSQVKRAPPNRTIRCFAHPTELKHFGDTRGVIHPGLGRRGSCSHRDLVEQAHRTVLEAVV